jgi:hypothetical protein
MPILKNNYTYKGKLHLHNQGVYSVIIKDGILLAFPIRETLLRLFLSVMETDCSEERLFSRLKHIKGVTENSAARKPIYSKHYMYRK